MEEKKDDVACSICPLCQPQFKSPHRTKWRNVRAFARVALRIPGNHAVIVSTGKFCQQKGSFPLMQDFLHGKYTDLNSLRHVIFVGDVEKTYSDVLRNQYLGSRTENAKVSREMKLHLLGSITSEKAMREFYNIGNIMVLNSECEAFGRVIVEAFAHGVPVLAKGCGGPAEIIKHGKTGLLFSTGAELMWYVDHLINNPEISNSISKRSCKVVANRYNSTTYMTNMESILARKFV
ncbi:hypothetical protein M9434_001284 [Picochlorum sp. BPE23]|nr:hypothetical protein M9434_001284 [Picochlorum sp. BPE23]